jgi:hypothetical protein
MRGRAQPVCGYPHRETLGIPAARGRRRRDDGRMAVAAAVVPTTSLVRVSGRRVLVTVAAAGLLGVSVVLLGPAVADLPAALERLRHGDVRWLALALGLEALSFLGHAILFRAVGLDERGRIGLRASTEITPDTPPPGCSPAPVPAASC